MPCALLFLQYMTHERLALINPFQQNEGNLQTPSPASHQSVSTIPETQTMVLQLPQRKML